MSLISAHDHRRRRAEGVRHLLRQLWGDDLPPGPDPELTVLVDAVAGDDHLGSLDGYVVQSDRLTYDALALLLRRSTTPALAARALPRDLLNRVFAVGHGTGGSTDRAGNHLDARLRRVVDLTGGGSVAGGPGRLGAAGARGASSASTSSHQARTLAEPADRSPETGIWRLDADLQVLSWDGNCAELLGRPEAPRHIDVLEEVEVWVHPEDRTAVAEGFDRCIRTAEPHQARFRALHPRGGWVQCAASGQRVTDADGKVHVVGVLRHDARTTPR